MTLPKFLPVVWREGLLLSPQHLQQHQRYMEDVVGARANAANPFAWGVKALQIDTEALRTGELRLLSFSGIFPDGTVLKFTSESAPAARPVGEHFSASASELGVYMALPLLREEHVNCAKSSGGLVRFQPLAVANVPDLMEARTKKEVVFGMPSVRLMFESEPRDGYTSIKVAEIERCEGGLYRLVSDYIPPSITISTSPLLTQVVNEILAIASTSQRSLQKEQHERVAGVADYSGRDITQYLLLSVLNSNIPLLKHFSSIGLTHPLSLYLYLTQFMGQLSTFVTDVDLGSTRPYDHSNLRDSFVELVARIKKMLGVKQPTSFYEVSLNPRRDGMWFGKLDDQAVACAEYVLAVDSEYPPQTIANELPRRSKIASWEDIRNIVRSALPGAQLRVVHRPPSGIPVRERTVYFLIETDNEDWRRIIRMRRIAIFFQKPYHPDNISVRLLGTQKE